MSHDSTQVSPACGVATFGRYTTSSPLALAGSEVQYLHHDMSKMAPFAGAGRCWYSADHTYEPTSRLTPSQRTSASSGVSSTSGVSSGSPTARPSTSSSSAMAGNEMTSHSSGSTSWSFESSRPMKRSEEHTSELKSLMRSSYAVF